MNARLAAVVLLAFSGAVAADEAPAAPDTSNWVCRFCPFESGTTGWFEPALGYVSDSSFHFGDWTGLDEQGLLLDLSGAVRQRPANSTEAWDLSFERLGLESRELSLVGGVPGSYRLTMAYDSLPHLVAGDSRSVFVGNDPLSLPSGWTTAGSTGGMPALDASLREETLGTKRERTVLGIELVPRRATELRFDYRRDEVRGTRATGGSFMTLATELPRPIDQSTDRADASAAVRGALGTAQLALSSSFFLNNLGSLTWDNPYNALQPGADTGQMAAAPDNRAHRLSLGLSSAAGAPLQASAQFAVGQLVQDDRFLPATLNPNEAVGLPRSSLDGRVDTTFASARAVYAFCPTTRAIGEFLHDKRDNRTPVAGYPQVVMDTFSGSVRRNAPYSSLRERWRVSVEDRTVPRLRAGAGYTDDTRERQLWGSATTHERSYWGRVGWRPVDGGDLRVRLTRADRTGDEFAATPDALAQNPNLRGFNTADRRRDEARGDASYGAGRVAASFNVIYGRDRYPSTLVGRTERSDFGYGADVTWQPLDQVSTSAFGSRRLQDTEQAGSQAFAAPDWFADQEDTTTVMGVSAAWQGPRGFEAGADYVYSAAEGLIAMTTGAGDTGFPLLLTRWHDARVYGRYQWRPDWSLRLDVLHESYRASDWQLDGVGPDTVANLLSLGQGTQGGDVTAVLLGLRYAFASVPPATD